MVMSKIFHLQGPLAYPIRTPPHVQRLYMPPTTNKKDSYQLSGNEDILPPQSKNIAKPQPSFQSSVPTQMADISIQMKSHLHKTDLHISKPSVQLKKEQREPAEPTNARLLNKELPFASNTSVDSHGSHLSAQMSNSSKMVNFSDLPPKSMPHINCSEHTTNQQVAQRSIINRQVVTHQSIPLALTENEGTDFIFTSAATASTTVSRPKGIIKQSTVESLGEDCTPQSGTATFTGKPLALDNTLVQTSVIPVKLVQDVSIPDHGLSPNIVSTAANLASVNFCHCTRISNCCTHKYNKPSSFHGMFKTTFNKSCCQTKCYG